MPSVRHVRRNPFAPSNIVRSRARTPLRLIINRCGDNRTIISTDRVIATTNITDTHVSRRAQSVFGHRRPVVPRVFILSSCGIRRILRAAEKAPPFVPFCADAVAVINQFASTRRWKIEKSRQMILASRRKFSPRGSASAGELPHGRKRAALYRQAEGSKFPATTANIHARARARVSFWRTSCAISASLKIRSCARVLVFEARSCTTIADASCPEKSFEEGISMLEGAGEE